MLLLRSWLDSGRGRGSALALRLKVPPSFIVKMASGEKPVPLAHMATIEEFTDGEVSRRAMRPDDWRDIWPELAANDPNPTPAPADAARVAIHSVVEGAHA